MRREPSDAGGFRLLPPGVLKKPLMAVKVFLAALLILAITTGSFAWYANSWLQSIGEPAAALDGYAYNADVALKLLLSSWLLLFLFAVGLAWKSGRKWPLWTTLVYFAAFAVLLFFWLDGAAFEFAQSKGLTNRSFTLGALTGSALVVIAGILTFAAHAITRRHHRQLPQDQRDEPGEDLSD
jgi:hypothetical protein